MACVSGPKIPTANLVINIDASNKRAANTYTTNLLFNKTWVTGNSSANGSAENFYNLNGTSAENDRIYDVAPNGQVEVVWQSPQNDATSDADGGWNSNKFAVDRTKTYRYSVWIRKKDLVGDGRAYMGVYGYDANSTNIGVYRSSNSGLNTNFYFMAPRFDTDLSPAPGANAWVLLVGHVLPTGTGNSTTNADSGVWNTSGTKIGSAGDCFWHENTTQAIHRTYQYYSTTTTEKQQWWQPRVDLCDGTQPSLASLLAGFSDATEYDLIRNVKIRAKSTIKTSNTYTYTAAVGNVQYGNTEFIAIDSSNLSFTTEQTIIMGLKPTSFAQRRNPYNQAYGPGTITQETSGTYTYFFGSAANSTTYTGLASNFTLANNEVAVIAVTRDTSNIAWYKNGNLDKTTVNPYPSTYFSSSDNKQIWIGYGYTGYGFVGDIYFTQVYNRALSAAEIRQQFEAVRGRLNL